MFWASTTSSGNNRCSFSSPTSSPIGIKTFGLLISLLIAVLYTSLVSHGLCDVLRGQHCHTVTAVQHLPFGSEVDGIAEARVGSSAACDVPNPGRLLQSIKTPPQHVIAVDALVHLTSPQAVAGWLTLLVATLLLSPRFVDWWAEGLAASAARQRCHRSVVLHC